MKKIFSIGEDMSLESGGQRTAIKSLHDYINSNPNDLLSTVITNKKEIEDDFTEFKTSKLWNRSTALKNFLEDSIGNLDLMHLHGAWMYTQFTAGNIALKNNIPYVMTLHGMIEPWYLKQKQLKKKIYSELVLKKILKNSNVIHAITPSEKENIYSLTGHNNIVEIPNLIHYLEVPQLHYLPVEPYFLFLGRLHPGKGLGLLIDALLTLTNKHIKLKIVGTENEYSNSLKTKIVSLGLEKRIEFLGSVFGDEKYKLFANAKAFIAPSYSEAIGMVNLEAAVCRTPVITTYNTGIKAEWNNHGGILISPTVDDLNHALTQASGWTDAERNDRGEKLRNFVIENYSWEKKGHLWSDLYHSL